MTNYIDAKPLNSNRKLKKKTEKFIGDCELY